MNLPAETSPLLSTCTLSEGCQPPPPSVVEVGNKCLHCRACLGDCGFLSEHGTPGQLARSYEHNEAGLRHLAFSCSLCNLCTQACSLNLEPGRMFLDLRREAVRLKKGNYKAHRKLLSFEKLGGSRFFSYLSLPRGCTTVFFPGCALPGARPDHTLQLYQYLQRLFPTLGIMLDCCNKPSHDLGRQQFFLDRFNAREQRLASQGIRTIITACTNCYQAFSQNSSTFTITTAYSILVDYGFSPEKKFPAVSYTIHDPCTTRLDQELHRAVRSLTADLGLQIFEMEHNRETTLCCGEGGAAGCLGGSQAGKWSEKRHEEANGQPLITYCAGCTAMLQNQDQVYHIVDLLFPDAGSDLSKPRQGLPLMTYLNRLKLKYKLKKLLGR